MYTMYKTLQCRDSTARVVARPAKQLEMMGEFAVEYVCWEQSQNTAVHWRTAVRFQSSESANPRMNIVLFCKLPGHLL